MYIVLFTHPYLKEALGELATKALVDDFRVYKEGKGLPTTFGRDVINAANSSHDFIVKWYS